MNKYTKYIIDCQEEGKTEKQIINGLKEMNKKINWIKIINSLFNILLQLGELLFFALVIVWFIKTNNDYLMNLDRIWKFGLVLGSMSLLIRMLQIRPPLGDMKIKYD